MGSASTYCGFPAYAWDRRPDELRQGNNRINFDDGCYFNIGDDMVMARSLIGQPMIQPDLGPEEMVSLRETFDRFRRDFAAGPPPAAAEEEDEPAWLLRWIPLVAAIFGAGGGVAAASSAFWCGGAGMFIKGPLGYSMAANCFGFGGAAAVGGGAVASAATAYIAASALVYLVPWVTFFDYVKQKLWCIWDHIRETIAWIWKKLAEVVGTLVSTVKARFSATIPEPHRLRD